MTCSLPQRLPAARLRSAQLPAVPPCLFPWPLLRRNSHVAAGKDQRRSDPENNRLKNCAEDEWPDDAADRLKMECRPERAKEGSDGKQRPWRTPSGLKECKRQGENC